MKKLFPLFLLGSFFIFPSQLFGQHLSKMVRAPKIFNNVAKCQLASKVSQHLSKAIKRLHIQKPITRFTGTKYRLPLPMHMYSSANMAIAVSSPQKARMLATDLLKGNSGLIHSSPGGLIPLEQNIDRFIFTISTPEHPEEFLGTGFVFAHGEQNQTRLWGATTAQIAQAAGPEMLITFHEASGQKLAYLARVVATGHPDGINTALLEIPEETAEIALPLKLPNAHVSPKSKDVFAFAFDKTGEIYMIDMRLFFRGNRLLANSMEEAVPLPLSGGLVVDDDGQLIGIFDKTVDGSNWLLPKHQYVHNPHGLDFVSEFMPVSPLKDLLKKYYSNEAAEYVMLLDGIYLSKDGKRAMAKIGLDEAISKIEVTYPGQAPYTLTQMPFLALQNLENVIPNVEKAERADVFITNKAGEVVRVYRFDLNARYVEQLPL